MNSHGYRAPKGIHGIEVPAVSEEAEGWLLTYLDVITLMLTFFVVLLAFSDYTKVETESRVVTESAAEKPTAEEESAARRSIYELMSDALASGVEVIAGDNRITLRIGEHLLFPSGEAGLTTGGQTVLETIAQSLMQHDYPLSIEGHTDDVPIATTAYPSNWELSAARAAIVLRHLETQGVGRKRMRAVGYADTRTVADNATEEGRAQNRRVGVVVFLNADGDGDQDTRTDTY